jgi:hypothetical protein
MAVWTQLQLDTLRAAIASGLLTVTYDGPPKRSVTYQSLKEMLALAAAMQQDINAAAGTTSYRLVSTRKGFSS